MCVFPALLFCLAAKALAAALQRDRSAPPNCLPNPDTGFAATVATEFCLSIPGVCSHTLSAEGLSRLVRWSFWGCWLPISYLLKLMKACVMAPYVHSASNYCLGWIKMQLYKLTALTVWTGKLLSHGKEGSLKQAGYHLPVSYNKNVRCISALL